MNLIGEEFFLSEGQAKSEEKQFWNFSKEILRTYIFNTTVGLMTANEFILMLH